MMHIHSASIDVYIVNKFEIQTKSRKNRTKRTNFISMALEHKISENLTSNTYAAEICCFYESL
jgi:hypothetical protein